LISPSAAPDRQLSARERARESHIDGEGQREREGESGKKLNGGRTEGGQELMGSHLIIVAVECAAAKIFASDMRRRVCTIWQFATHTASERYRKLAIEHTNV
jgi:hypothetical protein